MKKLFIVLFALILSFSIIGRGYAALIDRGNNLIYDTDLNITWYAVANNTGMNWSQANNWAAGLTLGGTSGWSLPTTMVDSSNPTYDNVGQMQHLYYTELNNAMYGPLINRGPFTNIRPPDNSIYWTGTVYQVHDSWKSIYIFNFDNGFQGATNESSNGYYALAEHPGDVGSVPEPSTLAVLALVGSYFGFRRKKQ